MRETAVAAALEMSAASEREAGCKTYRFYTDLADANTVFIFEEWESAEALAAHFETAHMADFRQKLPALLASEPEILQYEVSDVRSA
jgi:quinol monooxygenase YgiN